MYYETAYIAHTQNKTFSQINSRIREQYKISDILL